MEISNGVKNFEILEHKADLKIRAFGRDKKELFRNAMIGMFEGTKYERLHPPRRPPLKGRPPEEEIKKEIKVSSPDLNSLLVDFLSEALYLSQVNREVYFEVKFKKFSDTEIKGELIGQKIERFNEDIKAVTYHSLDVHQQKDGTWEATVLFDI